MAKIPDENALGTHRWSSPRPVERFDGSAMGAPGRAQQQLGQAIASLGKSLGGMIDASSAEDRQSQEYETKTRFLDLDLQMNDTYTEASRNMDPEGTGFRENITKSWDGRAREFFKTVPEHQKSQYDFMLRQRGVDYERKARDAELQRRDEYHMKDVAERLGTYGALIDQEPDNVREHIGRGLSLIDSSRLPVEAKLKKKDEFARGAEKRAIEMRLQRGDDPAEVLKDIETRPPPKLDDQGRPIGEGPAGPRTSLDPKSFFDGRVPTPAERRSIFRSGGVVVNLDSNWSERKDSQTGPLVVIPDNATPAQRQAAQAYADAVAGAYKEKFGSTLPAKVVTRSQNGRGRNDTIHTEPFAVTDTKAVDYFINDAGGRAKLAEITSSTLGSIPGVRFSLPHNSEKGDRGAHGPRGNEVEFASKLLDEMRGGSSGGSSQPAVADSNALRPTMTAYSPQKGGDKMEGGYASSKPGPDGKAEVRTLADVSAGRSQYVTLAGDPSQYGKTYTIPEITYKDASGKEITLKNVKGVVHDTGSAFKGKGDQRFDIPVDRDLPSDSLGAQPFSKKQLAFIPEGAADNSKRVPTRVASLATTQADATMSEPAFAKTSPQSGPVLQTAAAGPVARVTEQGQVTTLLDGIPDDRPLSQLPDDVRDQVMRLVPKDALKETTLPNGQKASAVDIVTVGEVKKIFAAPVEQVKNDGIERSELPPIGQQAQAGPVYSENAPYRWMNEADRKVMIGKAQVAQRNTFLKSGDGEVKYILQHGEESLDANGQTLMERAQKVLLPNQMTKLRQKIEGAKWRHQMVAPIPNLPESQIDAHLERMQPTMEDSNNLETYKAKSDAYEAAVKAAEKVRETRRKDGAASVEMAPEVRAARDRIKQAKSQTHTMGTGPDGKPSVTSEIRDEMTPSQAWETLIEARIEAQQKVFGDKSDPRIRSITKREAEQLLRITSSAEMTEDELLAGLKEAAGRADQIYGRYARRAFDDAVKLLIHTKQGKEDAAGLAQKIIRGEDLSAMDMHRYQVLEPLSAAAAFMSKDVPQSLPSGPVRALDGLRSRGVPAAPAGQPALMAQPPAAPKGQGEAVRAGPDPRLIQWMMQDPVKRAPVFDRQFGAGAAQSHLEWAKKNQPKQKSWFGFGP